MQTYLEGGQCILQGNRIDPLDGAAGHVDDGVANDCHGGAVDYALAQLALSKDHKNRIEH